MADPRLPHKDELSELRGLLGALENREMTLKSGGVDVTEREIEILRREIAHIEETLAWLRERIPPNGSFGNEGETEK